jgi:hypothetical protein
MYNTIVHGNRLGSGEAQDLMVDQVGPGVTQVEAHYCNIALVDDYFGLYTPSHVLDAPPMFYNPAGHDYHLRSGSPCIDAGTLIIPMPPGLPVGDHEGDPRVIGAAPDIGADEARPPSRLYLPLSASSRS